MGKSYWLDLFTGKTWNEFLASGGDVTGFRERRWNLVQQIRPGDFLLCYLTGLSRFIGVLEATSEAFRDTAPIWKDDVFPCRVRVRAVAELKPETAIPMLELRNLTYFQGQNPNAWLGAIRASPARWSNQDGQIVVSAVTEAASNPVVRPFDRAKFERRPRPVGAGRHPKLGMVAVPEPQEPSVEIAEESESYGREHTEIQWLLLKLGSDMGLDTWVARNDRGQEWKGNKFADLPRMRRELPRQFDDVTQRTIALIDVLWLKEGGIVAAFEIESTTSIYSGLLRMSDLLAMHPNLSIPLYLVAPDERRDKVVAELNRATFRRLSPPLARVCHFIPFSALRKKIQEVSTVIRYLKPDFLQELAESCEIEDL
ncbi:MAG TPA: hypothetical protein VLS25_06265 [Dehalococcoidia bacterium]|nr:hypothetical protein [Dehalococcoidia bacterium]